MASQGIVKCVLSGDTIVVRGRPVNGPPPERLLGLAWVAAPRLSKNENEPFAFQAREYLRKLLVGKSVQFQIEYTNQSGKEYASVFIVDAQGTQVNVGMNLLESGWVKLRKEESDWESLQTAAQNAEVGMWSKVSDSTEQMKQTIEDVAAYVKKYKGSSRKAIIEQVRDGTSFRVLFLDDLQYAVCSLAGIKSPSYRKDIPGMDDLVEPFAEEAKFFTETRLLQREVDITIQGHSNQSLIVNVSHPAGNISEILIVNGLARIVTWSIPYVGSEITSLRAAENVAKQKKLRIWTDFTFEKTEGGQSFVGTVLRIISGDTVLVESENGLLHKVTLSSLRQPSPKEDSLLNFEAKEYLRKKLIGKKVQVQIDYKKTPSNGFEERICVTITIGKLDIAEGLVSNGLATVLKHRDDDQDRATGYDALVMAQNKAQEAKKGLFGEKVGQQIRISDASENLAKARSFLPFFKRAGRISAVVEHVMTGSKFRLFIPKDSCKLAFALVGIRAPRVGRNEGDASDPFGPDALTFSEKKCLQRDVEIDIEGIDKTGGFIGSLYIGNENVGVSLLEEGLAYVHAGGADQSPNANALYAAENQAKATEKRIWSVYKEETGPSQQVEVSSNEVRDVVVTEIVDGSSAYVQYCGADLNRLDDVMKELEFSLKAAINSAPVKAKAGDLVAAKFAADNKWYRAKVRKVLPGNSYEIFYIDYGNSETISGDRLRSLGAQFIKLGSQAHEVKLSYIITPCLEDDYGIEAAEYLKELVEKPKMRCSTDFKTGHVAHVTLYDPEEVVKVTPNLINMSVNGKLLKQGYAQVDKKQRYKNQEALSILNDQEQFARLNRLGMFEYGDFELGDPGL